MKTFIVFWLSICCVAAQDHKATPTPTPVRLNWSNNVITKDEYAKMTAWSWSHPKEYTIVGSDLRFICYHEPLVSKQGDKWVITFKP